MKYYINMQESTEEEFNKEINKIDKIQINSKVFHSVEEFKLNKKSINLYTREHLLKILGENNISNNLGILTDGVEEIPFIFEPIGYSGQKTKSGSIYSDFVNYNIRDCLATESIHIPKEDPKPDIKNIYISSSNRKDKKIILKKILFILYTLLIMSLIILPTLLDSFIDIPGFINSNISVLMFLLGYSVHSVIFWVYEND